MKKIIIRIAVVLLILVVTTAWLLFGSATAFDENSRYIYVRNNEPVREQVSTQIDTSVILKFPFVFTQVAARTEVWDKLKPGRFEIEKGASIYDIVRMLRNNVQSPVRFTINKFRTKENFAKLISKNFDIDSAYAMNLLTSNDSLLKFERDTNTVFTLLIPDTYQVRWNVSFDDLLTRLKNESEKFWQRDNRSERATQQGLTPDQVYIIASIIDEETNKQEDKSKIASVYINRMNIGMPLAADPTVKYALRDFGLKRIYYGHLDIASPYNTYRNKGLPPGPICIPAKSTIDAVLDAPKTDYLFFVAKSDFSGYHHFSNNFAEHQQYAKEYQQALNRLQTQQDTTGEKH